MKRRRNEPGETMDIVWQTPANPPLREDYIFRDGKQNTEDYIFFCFAAEYFHFTVNSFPQV